MESLPPAPGAAPRTVDSLGVLRQRWWLVALVTLLGLGAAGAWLNLQAPVFQASTSVLVNPVTRDINVVGGRTQGQVNLDTEAQLVRSTAVAEGASRRLAGAPPEELLRQVTVQVPPNTSVLVITFAGATPAAAQAGSLAFAGAYLEHRDEAARAELAAQATAVEAKIEELNDSLAEINERLAGAAPLSAAAANLESQRGTVLNQLNTMHTRADELATATVSAGTVISEARLPRSPSSPRPAILLASGAALGLVAGLAAAGLAERLTRRVRRPADVAGRVGVPVLAALTAATTPPRDEIASPYGAAGRAFDRLRNEVVALVPEPGPDDRPGPAGQVIVVTGPTGGVAASLTAANLAASLSRAGHEVVLVCARGPVDAGGVLPPLLGVAASPGLSEVLAGRMPAADALQRSPREPRLRVLTAGSTPTAAGLLQSPALREALTGLTRRAGYVIVEAPPTSVSADAQSVAGHADTALLVVEQRRSRLVDVADAADQLRRVGIPRLGAVVLPPLRRGRPPEPANPARSDQVIRPRLRTSLNRPSPGRPGAMDTDAQTMLLPRVTGPDRDAGAPAGRGTDGNR